MPYSGCPRGFVREISFRPNEWLNGESGGPFAFFIRHPTATKKELKALRAICSQAQTMTILKYS